jgi:hypothetical protein
MSGLLLQIRTTLTEKLDLPSHSLILLLNSLILNTKVLYGILVCALMNSLVDNTNKYTSIKILIVVHLLILSIKYTLFDNNNTLSTVSNK